MAHSAGKNGAGKIGAGKKVGAAYGALATGSQIWLLQPRDQRYTPGGAGVFQQAIPFAATGLAGISDRSVQWLGMIMAKYDILMLVVLVAATLRGAWKGMAWQLASLASLGVSFFVALHYADLLAPYLSAEAPWNKFLAMLVLYLGCSVAIWAGFSVVAKFIERVQLREFDRQIGGLFGLLRGVLYCVVITFFAVTLSEQSRAAVLESKSGYYIALGIHRAAPVMPAEARELLGPYLDQLQRGLDPRQPAPVQPVPRR